MLAYGQTGSGKTYTILGPGGGVGAGVGCSTTVDAPAASTTSPNSRSADDDTSSVGVIPRALRELFQTLEHRKLNAKNAHGPGTRTSFRYEIRLQFLELYGEEVRDLLSTAPSPTGGLKVRDNGGATGSEPEVVGASEVTVKTADEALLCLARGMMRRVTGATAMNAESSRSHAIMTAVIEQTQTTQLDDDDDNDDGGDDEDGETSYMRSKFHFVDLAGSERAKRTQAAGQRLAEGIMINQGLLVLGNVISALGDPKKVGKTHVPYRDSKLTRLLRGSLGGNHRTLMVACVSPSSSNMAESINTLRYSNRARNIQNRAVVNVDPTTKLVGELRGRVKDLAGELLRVRAVLSESSGDANDIGGPFTEEALRILASGGEALSSSSPLLSPSQAEGSGTGSNAHSISVADATLQQRLAESDAELARVTTSLKRAKQESYHNEEGLYAAKAEAEYWKIKSMDEVDGDISATDNIDSVDPSIISRMAAYEKEIAKLKSDLREASGRAELALNTRPRDYVAPTNPIHEARTSIIADQVAEVSTSTLTALQQKRQDKRHRKELEEEEEAQRQEFERIAGKYLSDDDEGVDEDESNSQPNLDDEEPDGIMRSESNLSDIDDAATTASVESFLRRQTHMDAHLLELTTSIAAKEDLMEQLAVSQRRYESMREFYETKLEEMAAQVEAREQEREGLAVELETLKKSDKEDQKTSKRFAKLSEDIKAKDAQIEKLRRRQKELIGLTRVPSRNEAVLARLKSDVTAMKRQKVDLQKQISSERKAHLTEVAKLRKDATQRSREAAKWKAMSEKQKTEAERARNAAKSHVQEISKLRSRYRESEKRLRMKTLKRGVMEKVGLDPVLVGRRGARSSRPATAPPSASGGNQQKKMKRKASIGTINDVDVDRVRSFLDSKVADIGQKEATAEKLAEEWEQHLDLTERKEQLLQEIEDPEANTSGIEDELEALNIQIQYREGRIRQLSKRLGDAPSPSGAVSKSDKSSAGGSASSTIGNTFLDDREFKSLCAGAPPLSASHLTSKILFGMVVRERRRVLSLARTAASLDERAAEAEKLAESREEALVSHVEEERHQRALMAQNQQEQIMSLMALVQDEDEQKSRTDSAQSRALGDDDAYSVGAASAIGGDDSTGTIRPSRSTDSMVMILSNERIAVLERQVAELEGEREAKEVHKRNEAEILDELKNKALELEETRSELQHLKSSLRQVREMLSKERSSSDARLAKENDVTISENIGQSSSASTQDVTAPSIASLEGTASSSSTYRIVDDIIQEALHPSALSPRRKVSDHNKILSRGYLNSASGSYSSPGVKSRIVLAQGSDSEDEEDVPAWANDIMADLAIIAQGQMPPSLKKEKKKNKRKGGTKKEKSKGDIGGAGASSQPGGATSSRSQEESNVFERLTKPENWTGAVKQSFISSDRPHPRQIEPPSSNSLDPSPTGTSTRKDVESKVSFEEAALPTKVQGEDKKSIPKKPVFDRLTDPENFTGVQKQSFLSSSTHRQPVGTSTIVSEDATGTSAIDDDVADRTISEILASGSDGAVSTNIEEEEAGRGTDSSQAYAPDSSSLGGLMSPAANANTGPRSVFDRLISPSNYTGTQKTVHAVSTKKRHNDKSNLHIDSLAEEDLTSLQVASTGIQSPIFAATFDTSTPRAGDDDATATVPSNTEAVDTPPGGDFSGSSPEEQVESGNGQNAQNRERISEYTQQNVFERLTKTVTASYAVKHQAED